METTMDIPQKYSKQTLFSLQEAAKITGISDRTVNALIRKGLVKATPQRTADNTKVKRWLLTREQLSTLNKLTKERGPRGRIGPSEKVASKVAEPLPTSGLLPEHPTNPLDNGWNGELAHGQTYWFKLRDGTLPFNETFEGFTEIGGSAFLFRAASEYRKAQLLNMADIVTIWKE